MIFCKKPFVVDRKDGGKPFKVGCNQCKWCKKQRASEWSNRIRHETAYHEGNCFITLTYDKENLPKAEFNTGIPELGIFGEYIQMPGGTLKKKDLQDFWKRLRKKLKSKKIKYYAVGEYGDRTKRSHYHAIIFGLKPSMETIKTIKETWGKGIIDVGNAESKSIRYVANYVHKKLFGEYDERIYGYTNRESPFSTSSQGIGKQYAIDNMDNIINDLAIYDKGIERNPPKYYQRKVLEEITGDINTSNRHFDIVKGRKREKLQRQENDFYFDVYNIDSELPDNYIQHKESINRQLVFDNERLLVKQSDIRRTKEKI